MSAAPLSALPLNVRENFVKGCDGKSPLVNIVRLKGFLDSRGTLASALYGHIDPHTLFRGYAKVFIVVINCDVNRKKSQI
jgi:hypothetical protein